MEVWDDKLYIGGHDGAILVFDGSSFDISYPNYDHSLTEYSGYFSQFWSLKVYQDLLYATGNADDINPTEIVIKLDQADEAEKLAGY